MSEPYRKTSRPWEPQRYRQEAHSPEAKLPEGDLVFSYGIRCPSWMCAVSRRPMRKNPGARRRLIPP